MTAPSLRQQLFRRRPVSAVVAETGEGGGVVVPIGVMVLRRTAPDLPRGFRVPGYPVVPVLSVASCLHLISGLSGPAFALLAGWLTLAAVVHVTCSRTHSRLRTPPR